MTEHSSYEEIKKELKSLKEKNFELSLKLIECDNRFHSIFNNVVSGIVFTDPKGKIIEANKAFCEMTGYGEEEITNFNFQEFTPPEDYDSEVTTIREAIANKKRELRLHKSYITKSNSRIYVDLSLSIIYDKKYNPVYLVGVLSDISHQKQVEDELRESQRKYKSLFVSAGDAAFVMNRYNFIDCNDHACDLFELSREELLNKHPWEVSPEYQKDGKSSKDKAAEKIQAVLKEKSQKFEWIHKKSNGETFDAEVSLNIVDRKNELFMAIVRDMSEHKKAQEALRKSEERFNLAMLATSDGLWDWDLITNDIYYSPSWKKMIGYEDHELENKFSVWEKLVHPDDVQKSWNVLNEHIKGQKEKFDVEFRMKHKKGNWVDILSRAIAFFDENGKAYRVVGTHVDITERKRIKKELEDSELRWKFAIEGNNDGLWDWDLNTDEVYFSPKWKIMLGYEDNEVENHFTEWDKRVHPDDKDKAYEDIKKHLSGETDLYINEQRMRCKNGEYKWILDRGKVLSFSKDGKPIRMIGIHTDITERKNQEKSLRELNATKDKLFSIIAHDLRSPFNSIMGFAELINQLSDKYEDEDLKHYSGYISKSSQQGYSLLENLLSWAKSQTGRIQLRRENIELHNLIDEIKSYFNPSLLNKKITFVNEIDPTLVIQADIEMTQTIFRNLISNAIKFTKDGGEVSVKSHTTNKLCTISIIDSGIGLTEEEISYLFDIEANFTNIGTAKEKGSGLGLIICKDFIEQHGGTISVSSEPDKGSTFSFTIPGHHD